MPAPLPNSAAMDALVEELLTKDVYIVDYLPRTVPQNSGGQYFDVEYYLLNSPHYTALKDKFSSVIFKLMCYYRVCIPWDGGWGDQPNPVGFAAAVGTDDGDILLAHVKNGGIHQYAIVGKRKGNVMP